MRDMVKRSIGTLGLLLAATRLAFATPPSATIPPDLAGVFEVVGSEAIVTITPLYGSFYRTECIHEGWQGVIAFDRGRAIGVLRSSAADTPGKPGEAVARQTVDCSNMDQLRVTTSFENGGNRQSIWKRTVPHASIEPPSESSMVGPDDPPFGQAIDPVDQLPMLVHQTEPVYPDKARKAKIEGTVIVQAVVRRDGTIGETRVVRSVPGLDEAAIAAVRQWNYKPAIAKGKPVAMWVAMPVRFILPKK